MQIFDSTILEMEQSDCRTFARTIQNLYTSTLRVIYIINHQQFEHVTDESDIPWYILSATFPRTTYNLVEVLRICIYTRTSPVTTRARLPTRFPTGKKDDNACLLPLSTQEKFE